MKPVERCCGTCAYWEDQAECHRHAPRPQATYVPIEESQKLPLGDDVADAMTEAAMRAHCVLLWPRTARRDWCGDWVVHSTGDFTVVGS